MADEAELPGLAAARAVAFAAFFAALVPAAVLSVDAWAREERHVSSESGSPEPGKWQADVAPHLDEIHAALSADDPATDVWFRKSAQISGSEAGLNLIGATIRAAAPTRPRPILVVLPTLDEAKKYNRLKLQPTIDATPDLASRVADVKSRDAESSTAGHKKFRNGYVIVTGANSSAGLQMVSAHTILFEEVAEYPLEAGEGGDPVEQALSRADAWETYRPKRYYCSTAGVKGSCRITRGEEASDRGRRFVPCPACGWYQQLEFRNLAWRAERAPYGAHFRCVAPGCGATIEEHAKHAMLDAGVWIKTYVDDAGEVPPAAIAPADVAAWRARPSAGRDRGFALWKAYSKLATWDSIVKAWLEAKDQPLKLKSFTMRVLGEAWEERGDAPDAERLLERREAWPARRVPPGVLVLTAGVDVQGDRLEWFVWGWGVGLTSWIVDRGVIPGDPTQPQPWRALDGLLARSWVDGRGARWQLDGLAVDSGFLSQQVYRWGQRHAAGGRVFVLDPLGGWKRPALGTAQPRGIDFAGRKLGSVLVWPAGTWDLKSEHYAALRLTLDGPDAAGAWKLGAMHLSDLVDREMTDQLTAESLVSRPLVSGLVVREWVKTAHRRNEALDCAVYARALAHHLTDSLTPEDWAALAARRGAAPELVQRDLALLWAPPLPAVAAAETGAVAGEGAGAAVVMAVEGAAAPAAPGAPANPPRGRSVRGRVVH